MGEGSGEVNVAGYGGGSGEGCVSGSVGGALMYKLAARKDEMGVDNAQVTGIDPCAS